MKKQKAYKKIKTIKFQLESFRVIKLNRFQKLMFNNQLNYQNKNRVKVKVESH